MGRCCSCVQNEWGRGGGCGMFLIVTDCIFIIGQVQKVVGQVQKVVILVWSSFHWVVQCRDILGLMSSV